MNNSTLQTQPDRTYSFYLVCHDYIEEVRSFLGNFFQETRGPYNYEHWVTFEVRGANLHFDLMDGKDQMLSQNIVFQLNAKTLDQLHRYAQKYRQPVQSFHCDETKQPYDYHYVFVPGPHDICSVEISVVENIDK